MSNKLLSHCYAFVAAVWYVVAVSYLGDTYAVGVCLFAGVCNTAASIAHAWINSI